MAGRGGIDKRVLDPRRRRRIGAGGFSWIDRRFVREGHLGRLERDEILLYFFLVAVADKDGLSFWSDPRVAATLKITLASLEQSRRGLVGASLVAYERPLYQVLALEDRQRSDPDGPRSVGDILGRILERRREAGS